MTARKPPTPTPAPLLPPTTPHNLHGSHVVLPTSLAHALFDCYYGDGPRYHDTAPLNTSRLRESQTGRGPLPPTDPDPRSALQREADSARSPVTMLSETNPGPDVRVIEHPGTIPTGFVPRGNLAKSQNPS